MTRRIASAWMLVLVAAVAGACGSSDRVGGDTDAARGDDADVFAVASSEVAIANTTLFIRADDAHVDDLERVVRATTGGRVVLNELPKRSELAQQALRAIGFDAAIARQLAPLVRSDVVVSKIADGWVLWVDAAREGAAAQRVAAAVPGRAAVEDGVLRIATTQAAWDAPGASGTAAVGGVERWNELLDSRAGRDAVLIGVDAGRMAAVVAQPEGIRVAGRLGTARSCDREDDAVDALATTVSGDSTVAAAGTSARDGGRAALSDALDLSTTTLRRISAIDLGAGRLDRIRDALVDGAFDLRQGLGSDRNSQGLGVADAGSARPASNDPAQDGDPVLADEPGFARTRALADAPAARRAFWVDLAAVIEAAADDRLAGIERSVAGTLGVGVDGILGWVTCDGRFGAQLAVAAE